MGCDLFYNAIQKYGWGNFKSVVLLEGLSKEEADIFEIELISKYNTTNDEYGYNLSKGGNRQSINVLRQVFQYSLGGEYIGEYESISQAGKKYNTHPANVHNACTNKVTCRNYLWRFEKTDWIEPYVDGRNNTWQKKRVFLFNSYGDFLNEYPSIMEASEDMGTSQESIIKCCSGEKDVISGYIWLHEKDLNKAKEKSKSYYNVLKKIYKYDMDGNYLQSYNSTRDVLNEFRKNNIVVSKSGLWNCLNSNAYSYKGFMWSYEKRTKIIPYKDKVSGSYGKNAKIVYQYDIDGKYLNTYKDAQEAVDIISPDSDKKYIQECCRGMHKSAYKYKWSYTKYEILNAI